MIDQSNYAAETRYKHEILVDGEPVLFEICDTCPKVFLNSETIAWRDIIR